MEMCIGRAQVCLKCRLCQLRLVPIPLGHMIARHPDFPDAPVGQRFARFRVDNQQAFARGCASATHDGGAAFVGGGPDAPMGFTAAHEHGRFRQAIARVEGGGSKTGPGG